MSTHFPLKHVANEEARTVQHNLLHPDAMTATDHRFVPHAVFSEPQIAAVGLTEQEAAKQGLDYRVGRQSYGEVAYGWAMEDTEHFVKVLVDATTGAGRRRPSARPARLLADPAAGPGDELRAAGADVARGQYWIHPALAEVVENALLDASGR